MIYFIEGAPARLNGIRAIKIGYSATVGVRLAQIATDEKTRVSVIGVIPGDVAEENVLHRLFAQYRIAGEWFEYASEIVEYVSKRPDVIRDVWASVTVKLPDDVHAALLILKSQYDVTTLDETLRELIRQHTPELLERGVALAERRRIYRRSVGR